MTLQQAIGMRMREIRLKLHRTQHEIADRAGIFQNDLCQIEAGHKNITAGTLSRIVHQGLQINLATFFEDQIFAPINITHTEDYEYNKLKTGKRRSQDSIGWLFPLLGSTVQDEDPGSKKRSRKRAGK